MCRKKKKKEEFLIPRCKIAVKNKSQIIDQVGQMDQINWASGIFLVEISAHILSFCVPSS